MFSKKPKPNMELQEFIRQSLTAIIEGVCQAQEFAAGRGALINPLPGMFAGNTAENTNPLLKFVRTNEGGILTLLVEFDVAVGVVASGDAKAGIGVADLGIGMGGKVSSEESHLSRLRFVVPLVLPSQGTSKK